MPEFRWTASRLQRLRSAVRAFNAAITRRERELADEGLSHLSAFLPERVTTQGVMSRVHNVNDFRRIVGYRNDARRGRTSELTRILRTVRPRALEFTEEGGVVTTNYARQEHRYNLTALRRRRAATLRDMARPLYDGDETFSPDDMSASEYNTFVNNNDLVADDEGEPDESVVDVDAATLNRWRQEDAIAKRAQGEIAAMYYVYRNTWVHPLNFHRAMGRFEDMLNALDWLAENRPDVLNKEFAKGRDELDPYYITESGGDSNPYIAIPYQTRHDRAINYVVSVAERAGMHGLG